MKGGFAIASSSTLVYWQIFALKYVTRNARQAFNFKLGCQRDNALSFVYTITFVFLTRSLARFLARFYFLKFSPSILASNPFRELYNEFDTVHVKCMLFHSLILIGTQIQIISAISSFLSVRI